MTPAAKFDRSKQGVVAVGDYVFKKHSSLQAAQLERLVARTYVSNGLCPIAVPKYLEPYIRDGYIWLATRRIHGTTALQRHDTDLVRRLVGDLATFHNLFALHSMSSAVLYRDAILSNYIVTQRGPVHIDFSSSCRLVHCFDDLSLLLHPSWADIDESKRAEMVQHYLAERSRLATTTRTVLKLLGDQVGCQNVEDRVEHYRYLIVEMAQFVDVTGLSERLLNVDQERIRDDDFQFFHDFRTARAAYYRDHVWRAAP